MLFSIIVDYDSKGRVHVWPQKKDNLSQREQDLLSDMMKAVEKSLAPFQKNELPFEKTVFKP
jgi:hypothetical protein